MSVMYADFEIEETVADGKGNLYEASFLLRTTFVRDDAMKKLSDENLLTFRNTISETFLGLTTEDIENEGIEGLSRRIFENLQGKFREQRGRGGKTAYPVLKK